MFGLIDGVGSPDGLEDRAMRQYAAGMLSEERQQVELLGREAHFLTGPNHAETLSIDDEIAADDRPGLWWRHLAASQRHTNTSEQFLGAEWLGDIVVGAFVERLHLVVLGPARRQHDDRRRSAVPHEATHLDTID